VNLAFVDWVIVAALLVGMAIVAVTARRYTRSVSDFLAANRCAGRYLLTLSDGVGFVGVVGIVANFEKFYQAGFGATWWSGILAPVALVVALSGWVNYRYRATRAMTMAQFFEMRYSRGFRVFAGIVAWFSGVLNFGVFPGIVARFIIYFCGFPVSLHLFGATIPTAAPVMAFMLGAALMLILNGGMITVMITDFLQAQFINVAFLAASAALLMKFHWSEIVTTLAAAPHGQSLINPFNQAGIDGFNVWFFMIFAFKLVYNRLGWQGIQGFNCAAKSPHEARMAGILAEWRGIISGLLIILIPICAYTLMHDAHFTAESQAVRGTLASIPNTHIRNQMIVPLAIVHMLPHGIIGLLCASMILGTIGNDTTYLHAWGSIFIQDVVLPFRRSQCAPAQHMKLLRWSICGVAVFCFFFSLLFSLHDYIYMYLLVTGAIYLGGSGAVIIGGLYWSRGTNLAAWSALSAGGLLAAGGAAMPFIWTAVPFLTRVTPRFPFNGAWMALIASLSAIVVYIVVSLLTCREPFDLDKLLHRGKYAIATEHREAENPHPLQWLGINREFTRGDRVIYFAKIAWTAFWTASFVAGTIWGLISRIPDQKWADWWLFNIIAGLVAGVITVVWFSWGGIRDIFQLKRTLAVAMRDQNDDGSVPCAGQDTEAPAGTPAVVFAPSHE